VFSALFELTPESHEGTLRELQQANYRDGLATLQKQVPEEKLFVLANAQASPGPGRGFGTLSAQGARSARRSRAPPKPPVGSAKATVRAHRVFSKVWAMSRIRTLHSGPWLKGGLGAKAGQHHLPALVHHGQRDRAPITPWQYACTTVARATRSASTGSWPPEPGL
jgi:hypothetical protein